MNETAVKALVALVGLAGLVFSIAQFLSVQAVEARTPYLTKKLEWCEEAVKTTAKISTGNDLDETATNKFWQMYWGVMGLVENGPVKEAMIAFGDQLPEASRFITGSKASADQSDTLADYSLAIAHACRRELSREWSQSWAFSDAG